jgi:hypothetical protein
VCVKTVSARRALRGIFPSLSRASVVLVLMALGCCWVFVESVPSLVDMTNLCWQVVLFPKYCV